MWYLIIIWFVYILILQFNCTHSTSNQIWLVTQTTAAPSASEQIFASLLNDWCLYYTILYMQIFTYYTTTMASLLPLHQPIHRIYLGCQCHARHAHQCLPYSLPMFLQTLYWGLHGFSKNVSLILSLPFLLFPRGRQPVLTSCQIFVPTNGLVKLQLQARRVLPVSG